MATDNLRICSLNANGIRDHSKRAQLFTWLKIKKFDIVFYRRLTVKVTATLNCGRKNGAEVASGVLAEADHAERA